MSKTAPLINVFKADPNASVVPIEIPGLSLPPVKAAYLLDYAEYPLVEGRGTYRESSNRAVPSGLKRIQYTKGAGSVEAKRSEVNDDPRTFKQFGHSSPEKFLYDPATPGLDGLTGRRVLGALSLPAGVSEIVNAAVFLKVMMKKEGLSSLEDAEAKGLTIPEGAIFSQAISADICEGLVRVSFALSGETPERELDYKYGLASVRVPASARLRSHGHVARTKREFWTPLLRSSEKMSMVGRVVRHQLESGFASDSTHLQNVYDAPHSISPNADASDLAPISEILREGAALKVPREEVLLAVVMRQLQYLPFNLLRYRAHPELRNDAKGAIHTMLSAMAPGEFSHKEREWFALNFQAKPHTVLSSIAERLLARGMVLTEPQVDWRRLREKHADLAYDLVSEQMIKTVLHKSRLFFAGVQEKEAAGGLSSLY